MSNEGFWGICRKLRSLGSILCLSLFALAGTPGLAENIVFPREIAINVKNSPYNAKGDGKADDTAALQQALADACGQKVVYLPNGTYRVSDTLRFHCLGPMVYGQSERGVVIRLEDNAAGFGDSEHPKAVILSMTLTNGISADQFFRKLKHFTVDTGKNRGAIGIRMYSNNQGVLEHVTLRGQNAAKIGIDLGWMDQNGPLLVCRCLVEGFDTGIRAAAWINSQTLSDVSIKNCRRYGLDVGMQVLSCENLDIQMAPGKNHAIFAHDGCMLSLIDSHLRGTDSSSAAIKEQGGDVFLRNIRVKGFRSAIGESNEVVKLSAGTLDEYSSKGLERLYQNSKQTSLRLPIKQTPELEWESDTNKWLNVADYGAKYGDNQDDTEAFQKAFDTAAAQGKTVVYIPTSKGGDPNWYNLKGTATVHGTVRRVLGLNFSRIIGDGRFVIPPDVNHPVEFSGIYGFGGEPPHFQNDSTQPMIVRNSEGRIEANSAGDVFVEDVAGSVVIKDPKAHVWARQLNPESATINVMNKGGTLWLLGLKTERYGIKVDTSNGGQTEIIGAHIYTGFGEGDKSTLFKVTDSKATFVGVRAITFSGDCYPNMVTESRGSQTRTFPRGKNWTAWTLFSAVP